MMALELVALASFAFTRPVLSMFGAAPEWFISRDASRADIIGFALVVALLPAAVLTLVGVASRALGDRARDVTHIVLVTARAGLGVCGAPSTTRRVGGRGRCPPSPSAPPGPASSGGCGPAPGPGTSPPGTSGSPASAGWSSSSSSCGSRPSGAPSSPRRRP